MVPQRGWEPATTERAGDIVRACPTNSEYHVFVGNFVANFVENGRKPTKFPTRFWENGFLGHALSMVKSGPGFPAPSRQSRRAVEAARQSGRIRIRVIQRAGG